MPKKVKSDEEIVVTIGEYCHISLYDSQIVNTFNALNAIYNFETRAGFKKQILTSDELEIISELIKQLSTTVQYEQ